MVSEPSDEVMVVPPTPEATAVKLEGLAPVAVEALMPVIRRVADEHGASVIMVEQHIQLALEAADQAMVLVHGSIVLSDSAEKLRADTSQVESAYMSGSITSG